MKFKYTGEPYGCIDFVTAGVIKPGEVLQKGKVYEIPDDDEMLILACETNAAYEKIEEKPIKKTKKMKKGDK